MMQYFQDIESLNHTIQKFFRKGTATNNYFLMHAYADYIAQQRLSFISTDENAVFLLEKHDFYQLYYYLNDFSEKLIIPTDKPVVMEILYRGAKNKPLDMISYWKNHGFQVHLTRDNMAASFKTLSIPDSKTDKVVLKYAESEDEAVFTKELLDSSLDKYTGDKLTKEEIQNYLHNRNLICAYYERKMAGVLQFEIKNKVVWLGHIAVDARYRGKGIANELVRKYIFDNKQNENTRYQLWVIQDNVGAVKLYLKFGFVYTNKSTTSMLKMNKN